MKMMLHNLAAYCLVIALYGCQSFRVEVTPVQKVVQLLGGMLKKAKQEKHEEQVQYAGFKQFCDDTTLQKNRTITEADETIEALSADIQSYDTEVTRLGGEIEQHGTDSDGWEADMKAATGVRETERGDYTTTHADYSESVSALEKAVMTLKQQNYDRNAAAALLQQVQAISRLPPSASRKIQAFIAEDPEDALEDTFGKAPAATAYEFKSGDIVSMLEGLVTKFKNELKTLERDEVARRHTFTSLKQSLTSSIKDAAYQTSEKEKAVINNKQGSTDATADLGDVTESRAGDAKYLADLTASCTVKADEYAARQKLRTEEIEALDKAVEIISSNSVTGAAQKHLPSALQLRMRPSALVQTGSETQEPDLLRVAAFLRDESKRLDSRVLSTLATHAQKDPFGKVKQLISELLERMQQEMTNEATHKGWCDKELSTNAHTRKTKSELVDTLTADIDGLEANVAQLTKDVAGLNTTMNEIDADVAVATGLRNTEKFKNNATTVEAQEAQKALGQALQVLQEFYKNASKATALAQRSTSSKQAPPAGTPEIFDEDYKGMQSENGGVVGMLEVIQSDFARLEQETAASETASQTEYEQFMEDSAISKAEKESEKKHKSSEIQQKGITITDKKGELDDAENALGAAKQNYEALKEPCLSPGQTYEERKAAREDEIDALKEALRILSGDDLLSLQQQ